jgi:hypothetical protein
MSTPNAMVGVLDARGDIVAEVATLAMNDTVAAYRAMSAPDAAIVPRIYLYHRARLQRSLLPISDAPNRTEWVLGALLPVIIIAGQVAIVAVVHAGRTSAPVRREATFLHVLSGEQEESWHAGIYRRQDNPPQLGSWTSGAAGALSEHTIAAIRDAVRSSSGALSCEGSP